MPSSEVALTLSISDGGFELSVHQSLPSIRIIGIYLILFQFMPLIMEVFLHWVLHYSLLGMR